MHSSCTCSFPLRILNSLSRVDFKLCVDANSFYVDVFQTAENIVFYSKDCQQKNENNSDNKGSRETGKNEKNILFAQWKKVSENQISGT